MASIIWCDHVKHVVQDSRSEVEEAIRKAQNSGDTGTARFAKGFVYFRLDGGHQRALNVNMISSFESVPGDGV